MGVNVYLNPFFLALLGLFFVAGIMDKGLIAFGVVLAHEFAHTAMAKRLGVPVSDVELLPFGGVTRMGADMPLSPDKEILIAAAGPACNLALFLAGLAFKNHGLWDDSLGPFFLQSNMIIAAFNILPALPLDGGRVYRALLAGKMGVKNATYRAAGLGQAWAVMIMLAGSLGLVMGKTGLDILITGLFLFYASTRERVSAPFLFMRQMMQKKEELLKAGVLPAEGLVAREDVSLGEVVRLFLPQRFHFVAVYSSEMEYLRVLPENQIIDALFENGFDYRLGDVDPP
jgi:stage IV sporulation protein FB